MTPPFLFEDYFQGPVQAFGMFQDRFHKVRNRFRVDMNGEWDGHLLRLAEDFRYDDGRREQRTWLVTPLGQGRYSATAEGLIGQALGQAEDNAVFWNYRMALRVGGKAMAFRFDDRMYLQEEGVLLNRARMFWHGLFVGEIFLSYRKGG